MNFKGRQIKIHRTAFTATGEEKVSDHKHKTKNAIRL